MSNEQPKKPTMIDRLDWYRLYMGWSMAEFAALVGLDYSVVRRALTGETAPHDYNENKFKAYYELNKEEIDEMYDAMTAGARKGRIA